MCEKDVLKAFPDVEENYCVIPFKTSALVAKLTIPFSLSFSTQNMNELDLYAFQVGFLSNFSQLCSWQMAVVMICNLVLNVEAVTIASGSYWNCHALHFLKYSPLFFPV